MSDIELIEKKLTKEKNKLTQLEIEIQGIDSDSIFYQRNDDLEKIKELQIKKEELISQFNSQKSLVSDLQNQLDESLSKKNNFIEDNQKENFKKEQEKILLEKQKEKQDTIKKEKEQNRVKEKEEQDKIKKEKQNTINREKFKTKQNYKQNYKTTTSTNKCPYCGSNLSFSSNFCTKCGKQVRNVEIKSNNENKLVRIFLKKKKDDGTYRFSISKSIGTVMFFIIFFNGIFYRGSIIFGVFWGVIFYLVFLIVGIIMRRYYNNR